MQRRIFILAGILFLFSTAAGAEEKIPFLGEITTDRVNLRAGPNLNFERLAQLSQGEEVVVVAKEYGWAKIKLPVKASCYIKADFVKSLADDVGTVTGNRVRLRAGAGENFSTLGKLDKGTFVRLFEQTNGWYRIEPIEGGYGYVSEEFVKFKSEVIPPPHMIAEPVRNIYRKKILEEQATPTPAAEAQVAWEPPPEEFLTVIGQLVDQGRMIRTKELRYKLVSDGKPVYYLIGDSPTFNSIINQNVEIKGKIKESSAGTYNYPVLVVSEIKVIP